MPKDNGGVRVTIDMRQPNKAIKDTKVPIPRAEDSRAELVGASGQQSSTSRLELSPASRYLTIFNHGNKLKRHTRLTMGCKPEAGELNKALRPLLRTLQQCISYMTIR